MALEQRSTQEPEGQEDPPRLVEGVWGVASTLRPYLRERRKTEAHLLRDLTTLLLQREQDRKVDLSDRRRPTSEQGQGTPYQPIRDQRRLENPGADGSTRSEPLEQRRYLIDTATILYASRVASGCSRYERPLAGRQLVELLRALSIVVPNGHQRFRGI